MTTTPSPLTAAKARVQMRKDIAKAVRHPGRPTQIHSTVDMPRKSQHVRASNYRRGRFPYGLAMPAEYVRSVTVSADEGLYVVMNAGAELPPKTHQDRRADALVRADRTGSAKWPGTILDRSRLTLNYRLRGDNLHLGTDRILRKELSDD